MITLRHLREAVKALEDFPGEASAIFLVGGPKQGMFIRDIGVPKLQYLEFLEPLIFESQPTLIKNWTLENADIFPAAGKKEAAWRQERWHKDCQCCGASVGLDTIAGTAGIACAECGKAWVKKVIPSDAP
jgi:hypothetical protein